MSVPDTHAAGQGSSTVAIPQARDLTAPRETASLVPSTSSAEDVVGGTVASGLSSPGAFFVVREGREMVKVEAVVIRERVETVMEAVEEETGHVGVTVVEAVGHGREKGITHEYRGRVFESRFLPKALLVFIVDEEKAGAVVAAICDSARSGNESGDGIVWTSSITNVRHNRTGKPLEEVERR